MVREAFDRIDDVLGVIALRRREEAAPPVDVAEIERLIDDRRAARRQRDFSTRGSHSATSWTRAGSSWRTPRPGPAGSGSRPCPSGAPQGGAAVRPARVRAVSRLRRHGWPGSCIVPGHHAYSASGKSWKTGRRSRLPRAPPPGYAILARRFRTRHGEIDIVARDGDVLVFVEVKARTSRGFGGAVGAVTARKQRQVIAMAQRYMARVRWAARPCRFDVVAGAGGRRRAAGTSR